MLQTHETSAGLRWNNPHQETGGFQYDASRREDAGQRARTHQQKGKQRILAHLRKGRVGGGRIKTNKLRGGKRTRKQQQRRSIKRSKNRQQRRSIKRSKNSQQRRSKQQSTKQLSRQQRGSGQLRSKKQRK